MNQTITRLIPLPALALVLILVAGSAGMTGRAQAATESRWKDIAVGGAISLGIKNDGTVWAWGEGNQHGSFGNGEKGADAKNPMVPVMVKGLTDVKALAAGQDHALALKNDGTVWAWGNNDYGQVGDGTKTELVPKKSPETGVYEMVPDIDHNRAAPVQVLGLDHVASVAAFYNVSYAVKEDGTLWQWGYGVTVPQQLPIDHVASVGTSYPLLVVKRDGTVWSITDRITPIQELSGITTVAGGDYGHYSALRTDGSVWDFTIDYRNGVFTKPEQDPDIWDVTAIESNTGGLLFLKKDGSVWASGSNQGGRLGIGSYQDSVKPVRVNTLMKVVRIAGHIDGLRSMAIREDGTLWSWGAGYTGDGTPWYRLVPVWIKSSDGEPEPPKELITVLVDGKRLEFERQPYIDEGLTMVPLRTIAETVGADVAWNSDTKEITLTRGSETVVLTIGGHIAFHNGNRFSLDTNPALIEGTTFVPLRFIAESFGVKVHWEGNTQTVSIRQND